MQRPLCACLLHHHNLGKVAKVLFGFRCWQAQHEERYAKMVTIRHMETCILADIIVLEGIKVQMLKIQKEDYVLWFPKGNKSHLGKFTRKWFRPYKVQYVLPKKLCYWWPLRSLRLTLCWSMWISSNLTNTWNMKFINKNKRC